MDSQEQIDTLKSVEQTDKSYEILNNILESGIQILPDATINLNNTFYDELSVKDLTIEFINGHPIENLVFSDREISVKGIKANSIHVSTEANYQKLVNKVPVNDLAAQASTNDYQQIYYDDTIDTLNVDALTVEGFLNQANFLEIEKFALKTNTDQVLNGRTTFNSINAKNFESSTGIISGKKLSNLVLIKGGNYTILQESRFDEPLEVNRLFIERRLNNIIVDEGQLKVLMKNSEDVQIFEAETNFEFVKLKNPIVLHGKISSSNLEKINPIFSQSDDIFLNGSNSFFFLCQDQILIVDIFSGDFEITGNVTIRGILRGENIYGKSKTFNIKTLFADGLSVNAVEIDNLMEFAQPINSKNWISGMVNGFDSSKFVRTTDIQIITAKKTFIGDLTITEGLCDAHTINGVQIQVLNETVLKKSGNQMVSGNITFNKITSGKYEACKISDFQNNFLRFTLL